jgi:hypothetical protein
MPTATWHINIDRKRQCAFIPKQSGKKFEWIEAGTDASAEILANGIDVYNVGHSELIFSQSVAGIFPKADPHIRIDAGRLWVRVVV